MSRLHAYGITPATLTMPNVGRRPVTPFNAAGMRTEPPEPYPARQDTGPRPRLQPSPAGAPGNTCRIPSIARLPVVRI